MSANVSPVAWYGGKSRTSARIAGLLPRHDTYIEVFGGGAAVLFAKPRAQLEVYNDIDDGLVTFFRVLRDRPAELQQALALTPYAGAEFEHCRDSWAIVEDELERAPLVRAHPDGIRVLGDERVGVRGRRRSQRRDPRKRVRDRGRQHLPVRGAVPARAGRAARLARVP
jgi:hypothetical protein